MLEFLFGHCGMITQLAWILYEPLIFILLLIVPAGWAILFGAALVCDIERKVSFNILFKLWIIQAVIGYIFIRLIFPDPGYTWPVYYSPFCQ